MNRKEFTEKMCEILLTTTEENKLAYLAGALTGVIVKFTPIHNFDEIYNAVYDAMEKRNNKSYDPNVIYEAFNNTLRG